MHTSKEVVWSSPWKKWRLGHQTERILLHCVPPENYANNFADNADYADKYKECDYQSIRETKTSALGTWFEKQRRHFWLESFFSQEEALQIFYLQSVFNILTSNSCWRSEFQMRPFFLLMTALPWSFRATRTLTLSNCVVWLHLRRLTLMRHAFFSFFFFSWPYAPWSCQFCDRRCFFYEQCFSFVRPSEAGKMDRHF